LDDLLLIYRIRFLWSHLFFSKMFPLLKKLIKKRFFINDNLLLTWGLRLCGLQSRGYRFEIYACEYFLLIGLVLSRTRSRTRFACGLFAISVQIPNDCMFLNSLYLISFICLWISCVRLNLWPISSSSAERTNMSGVEGDESLNTKCESAV
jgi:hypothetical protein